MAPRIGNQDYEISGFFHRRGGHSRRRRFPRRRWPSPQPGEGTANPVAHQTSAGNTSRVYCYNGVKGDQDNLYRGWICVPENSAAAAH